jgi:hypothetical protein
MENKPKQTRKRKPKGLGDTIENVFQATGIDKIAKFVLGEDCGCDERKEKLNKLFPYKKVNCLEENEYNYLTTFFERKTDQITPVEQSDLLAILNRLFNTKHEPTTCSSCWRDYINQLKKVYEEY